MSLKNIFKSISNFLSQYWKKWTIFAILAIVIYAGFIYYEYIYKSLYLENEITAFKLEIKKSAYQDIMDNYTKKQETIDKIINKDYLDPFK